MAEPQRHDDRERATPRRPEQAVPQQIPCWHNPVRHSVPEEQAFLKDAAERRRPAIEAGISAAVGHPVTVRCVVANVELPPAAPDAADASFVLAEARRIFADDIVDVGEIS
jgi:hypothetical protein